MEPYFFLSYSHKDREIVSRIASELKKRSINTWQDSESLNPGDNWQDAIENALRQASGLLFFISKNSLQSQWARHELRASTLKQNYPVIPIILEDIDYQDFPLELLERQYLDLTRVESFDKTMDRLADDLRRWATARVDVVFSEKAIQEFSQEATSEARGTGKGDLSGDEEPPGSVFIVHGHDDDLLDEVDGFVRSLGG